MPCDPGHPLAVSKPARPEPAFDVAAVQGVGSLVICQYESSEEDTARGLRAVVRLDPDRARVVCRRDRFRADQAAPALSDPHQA